MSSNGVLVNEFSLTNAAKIASLDGKFAADACTVFDFKEIWTLNFVKHVSLCIMSFQLLQ